MAPGRDGMLFVVIPGKGGSVLTLLDSTGRSRPGWPITLKDSTSCPLLLPVEDGSVRVVCDATDLPQYALGDNDVRAFAFDASGRSMTGWPVQLPAGFTGRVIGSDLTLLEGRSLTDTATTGQVSGEAWLTTVAADGSIRRGTVAPVVAPCCAWAVGPDGVAYGVAGPQGRARWIVTLDASGTMPGWPTPINGAGSGPVFRPDGRVVLTVASVDRKTSRILVWDPDSPGVVSARSAAFPLATAGEFGETGSCGPDYPQPPLIATDGTAVVFSQLARPVFALDSSLRVMEGWPYRPGTPLVRPDSRYVREDAFCPSLAIPAVGPDGTVFLPLQARDATVGGSIVAVDPDGRVRRGWPVELRRPGSEFWAVVVGPDGTAFALAIELESSRTSSASILAIGPDSTVLYRTTIIDP